MHHLYPLAKGDPLCPLGFHPQVRWPTRCKRCFRDYKEHGGKKKDDESSLRRDESTASSPSLTSWGSLKSVDNRRSWSSSTNLAKDLEKLNASNSPTSWTSTSDLANLEDDTQASIPTVNLTLPKRKQIPVDRTHRTVSDSASLSLRERSPAFSKNDTLAIRAKKLQALKEASQERSKRIQIKEVKASVDNSSNHDVQFIIQVKPKPKNKIENNEEYIASDDDTLSTTETETTDTTLVGEHTELQEQIDSLQKDLDTMKTKCDRLEREKSDLLLRRIAAMETTTSKTTATEVLKLQRRCNDLQTQVEDLKDDKKSLALKLKEMEQDLEKRPTAQSAQKIADDLRSKLLAAETLCEELMDENEDMKKELRDLEDEMEEMQDNFREDQADEYSSLKKELEQTTKNCRILSFKLRKTERRSEQLELERVEAERKLLEVTGGQNQSERIKNLEQDLKTSNEASSRLKKELQEVKNKLTRFEDSTPKRAPKLGDIPKLPSSENKVSRESLTRGGSQEDPSQLLRDLHDSLEREADLREQLKFAEEEAQNLRKKASRIEDDNESLVLQLKKMASKTRTRKLSPNRLTPDGSTEKTDDNSEDPNELRLLMELNEQEASVLRKKVEELEAEKDSLKKKIKDLQDKLVLKSPRRTLALSKNSDDSKVKILEEEIKDLRKSLTEKSRENDKLQSEINFNQRKSKTMAKSKSLELDQQTLDLKRQLQIIEQEAIVLRTKIQSLESENDKLSIENKRLQLTRGTKLLKSNDKPTEAYKDQITGLETDLENSKKKIEDLQDQLKKNAVDTKVKPGDKSDVVKLKQQLSKAENERDKFLETIKKMKEGSYKIFKDRSPKKPSDFTSKVQLKSMVNELENEISEMLIVMKNYENQKCKLEEELKEIKSGNINSNELSEMKKKLFDLEKELNEERRKLSKEMDKSDNLNNSLSKLKEDFNKAMEEKNQLLNEIDGQKLKYQKLINDKISLENDVSMYQTEYNSKETELNSVKRQCQNYKTELDKKDQEMNKLKKDMEDKTKISKDLEIKIRKTEDLEKQLKTANEELKKAEKSSKDHLKQLENKIEELREESRKTLEQKMEINTQWSSDCKYLNLQIDELNSKIKSLENIVSTKNTLIQQLEDSIKKERSLSSNNKNTNSIKEINNLKDELNKKQAALSEVELKLETMNKNKKTMEEKLKKVENDYKKGKIALDKKIGELEIDLQNEKKKIEVMKVNHDKENKNKEMELSSLKCKIRSLELNGSGNKKSNEIKQEYQDRIDKLELALKSEKQEYDDLTAKYEVLEEEHVVTKAKLVMEKEALNNQLFSIKRDLDNKETELDALKDTQSSKSELWSKEKTELQEKCKKLEKKILENSESFNLERNRLKSNIEERQSQLDQTKKECEMIQDQIEYMRKENDELRKKLDDYNKVTKVQRNISADTSAMEKEMRQLRTRLVNAEKARKTDLAECKMRYDCQVTTINEELQSLHSQVMRFKRERDTYKHMLEGAQKTIGELKSTPAHRRESKVSIASLDEFEESRMKIANLEQHISCMEDELSEARLETSKLKTELVSERSSWEIKLSELHSHVNELEEERLLNSGRTKIPGLKTKMELAWQKEREEQQRLLQETSTLARDLRQTLFEVERERDKERLEIKRKMDQLKKSTEEDQDENKRKVNELQCDLLELRDAHAKLRTTNEKLRREKERHEREREEFKSLINGKKRTEIEDERRINTLLEQVEALIKVLPEYSDKDNSVYTPTPPRRFKGPKSRESSPSLERKDVSKESLGGEDHKLQVTTVMHRLMNIMEELRRYQKLSEEERDRERVKRAMGQRRATSTEHDQIETINITKRFIRNGSITNSLHRKSLSLEQTAIKHDQNIWRTDDSLSSLHSLETGSEVDAKWNKDTNLDSRLSGGSTQSDTAGGERKKKTGLIGKLKKLTKSRSIDDQDPGHFSPAGNLSSKHNSSSDVDEVKGSKKDIKERITGIFKKGGSSSRSNSLERRSTQRPLMPNGSNTSISQTSPNAKESTKVSSKPVKRK